MKHPESVSPGTSKGYAAATGLEGRVSEEVSEAFRRLNKAAASGGRDHKLVLALLQASLGLLNQAGAGVFESGDVEEGGALQAASREKRTSSSRPTPSLATKSRLGAIVDSWSDDETAWFLGVGLRQVRRRSGEGTLFYFTIAGRRRYPIWQFSTQRRTLPGVHELFAWIPGTWAPEQSQRFMTSFDAGLRCRGEPMSPVDWLALGLGSRHVVDLLREASGR